MSASVAERVARVEGRVEEHAQMMDGIRQAVVSLEGRMDRRFESIEQTMARQFHWIVGLQMTMFAALVATILTALLGR